MVGKMNVKVPPQVKALAEKTDEQPEKAFNSFIQAACKSADSPPFNRYFGRDMVELGLP